MPLEPNQQDMHADNNAGSPTPTPAPIPLTTEASATSGARVSSCGNASPHATASPNVAASSRAPTPTPSANHPALEGDTLKGQLATKTKVATKKKVAKKTEVQASDTDTTAGQSLRIQGTTRSGRKYVHELSSLSLC